MTATLDITRLAGSLLNETFDLRISRMSGVVVMDPNPTGLSVARISAIVILEPVSAPPEVSRRRGGVFAPPVPLRSA